MGEFRGQFTYFGLRKSQGQISKLSLYFAIKLECPFVSASVRSY